MAIDKKIPSPQEIKKTPVKFTPQEIECGTKEVTCSFSTTGLDRTTHLGANQVYQYLIQTKQFELIQKRMSATAFRELLQMGMNVPGVKATELTRVNFRSK